MARIESGSDPDRMRRSAVTLFLKILDLDPELANRPVARLCALMLTDALHGGWEEVRVRAPGPKGASILYARAGERVEVMQVPTAAQTLFVNRLKVMAKLDLGRPAVQEGFLKVRLQGQASEITVTVRRAGDAEEASLRLPAPVLPFAGEGGVNGRRHG